MYKKIVVSSLLAIMATATLATANAADRQGPPKGGKPPAEAITACADMSANDSCTFKSPRGDEVSGTCSAPPNGDDVLACAPEGGRPPQ